MIIYKFTNNVNGKSYIGQTNDFKRRKSEHISCAKRKCEFAVHRAIHKYGLGAFTWEVLHECDDREELSKMEIHYIKEHDTYRNGYNMTVGGEHSVAGRKGSPEHRMKMSKIMKGRVKFTKTYLVTTPVGETINVDNLAKFCRENKINNSHMTEVAQGKRKQHKGYKCSFR